MEPKSVEDEIKGMPYASACLKIDQQPALQAYTLVDLPPELLVYIFSFITSARDNKNLLCFKND